MIFIIQIKIYQIKHLYIHLIKINMKINRFINYFKKGQKIYKIKRRSNFINLVNIYMNNSYNNKNVLIN